MGNCAYHELGIENTCSIFNNHDKMLENIMAMKKIWKNNEETNTMDKFVYEKQSKNKKSIEDSVRYNNELLENSNKENSHDFMEKSRINRTKNPSKEETLVVHNLTSSLNHKIFEEADVFNLADNDNYSENKFRRKKTVNSPPRKSTHSINNLFKIRELNNKQGLVKINGK